MKIKNDCHDHAQAYVHYMKTTIRRREDAIIDKRHRFDAYLFERELKKINSPILSRLSFFREKFIVASDLCLPIDLSDMFVSYLIMGASAAAILICVFDTQTRILLFISIFFAYLFGNMAGSYAAYIEGFKYALTGHDKIDIVIQEQNEMSND
jgi:hypothetical protein